MSIWGKLATRYQGAENQQHKLLALDGGGLRSIIALEVLLRMEEILAELSGGGPDFRLCHFFDYIGGTSTGAIIAAGLARGMSARGLLAFFQAAGPAMFDRQFIMRRWQSSSSSEPLQRELQKVFGAETTLKPDDLECLLLAVTRNRTTNSPWPITSNPQAKYNDASRPDCNLNIPLWQIARASTGAPDYFPPEVVRWDPFDENKGFVFGDGGLTPYNNPAFLLYRMATQSEYRLSWSTGEDKLLLMSVGAGAAASMVDDSNETTQGQIGDAAALSRAIVYAAMIEQDTICRTVGRCVHGAVLDREIGDMIPKDAQGNIIPLDQDYGRNFLYIRYNADLSREGLNSMGLSDIKPQNVQKLDSIEYNDDLRRVGRKLAEEIKLEHFGSFIA